MFARRSHPDRPIMNRLDVRTRHSRERSSSSDPRPSISTTWCSPTPTTTTSEAVAQVGDWDEVTVHHREAPIIDGHRRHHVRQSAQTAILRRKSINPSVRYSPPLYFTSGALLHLPHHECAERTRDGQTHPKRRHPENGLRLTCQHALGNEKTTSNTNNPTPNTRLSAQFRHRSVLISTHYLK